MKHVILYAVNDEIASLRRLWHTQMGTFEENTSQNDVSEGPETVATSRMQRTLSFV